MRTKTKHPRYIKAAGTPSSCLIADGGELEIQAVAGDDKKPPTFSTTAYTGKAIRLSNFDDPVIIDLEGARFDKKKTPLIQDHKTELRIGHTTEDVIVPAGQSKEFKGGVLKGPVIAAAGLVSSGMGVAGGFVADAKNGFPFQTSVGAEIVRAYFVPAGEKVKVNGKQWKGPLNVVAESLIRELSVTVLGADSDTSSIAANTKLSDTESNMNEFEKWLKAMGFDPEKIEASQKAKLQAQFNLIPVEQGGGLVTSPPPKKAVKAKATKKVLAGGPLDDEDDDEDDEDYEPRSVRAHNNRIALSEERADGIRDIYARFSESGIAEIEEGGKKYTLSKLKAHAIREGWTPDDFELRLRRAERPKSQGPGIHTVDRDINAQALECSLLRYAGVAHNSTNKVTGKKSGLEAWYKPEVLEASEQRQYQVGGSIQALLDMQIRAAGQHFSGISRRGKDFLEAAVHAWESVQASGFSTLNITVVLENVLYKTALSGYEGVEAVWRSIAARRPLNDFKPHALYRLDLDGSFKKVAADGELKHISMTDSKKTLQAETYGCMIAIDRKTIKNDDMGLILDQARGLGVLGAQRIEESVFVLLLSNPSSFFATGNGNLISGGTSVLSMGGLDLARAKFRNQVVNGKPTSLSPTILLLPSTLETTGRNLYTQETFVPVGATDASVFPRNPHVGLYRPVVTPYLNNTAIRDQNGNALSGQSDTAWYLMADPNAPQGAAIVIGFIDGRETPFFDEADTAFNVPGGIQFRSYLDWGVNMHMTQHAVKSAGA